MQSIFLADAILLDVKTGSGAFMKTQEEARRLVQLMVDTGRPDTASRTGLMMTPPPMPEIAPAVVAPRLMRKANSSMAAYFPSFMQRWTAAVVKVLGRARMLGFGPTYFFMASARASSMVARVLRPIPRAMPGSRAPTM